MSGGSLPNKNDIYCSLEQYLLKERPNVYDLYDFFNYPIQVKGAGITFMMPSKALEKDLIDLKNGDKAALAKYKSDGEFLIKDQNANPDQIGPIIAKAYLKALILTWYYPEAEDFKKNTIVNKGYRTYKFVSGSGDKVKLDIGDLTKEKKFHLLKEHAGDDKGQVAIWNLSGSPKIDTPKHEGRSDDKQGGGIARHSQLTGCEVACHIFEKVKEYKANNIDIEIAYLVNLLEYISKHNERLYDNLACLVSSDALVTLLLLIKPGNEIRHVPNDLLVAWYKRGFCHIRPNALAAYNRICDHMRNISLDIIKNDKYAIKKREISYLEKDRSLNASDVCELYQKYSNWFPLYTNIVEKINDDLFRATYETGQSKGWDLIIPRLNNSHKCLKNHFLNPKCVLFCDDSREDLVSFMNSPYFMYCCGAVDYKDNYTSEITEPKPELDLERIQELLDIYKQ